MAWIREANRNDIEPIKRFVANSLDEFGLSMDYETSDSDLAAFEIVYLDSTGVFFVAMDEKGEVVGTIGLVGLSKEEGKIRKMYVAKSSRGQGLGRELLDRALNEARKKKFHTVWLETMNAMECAIRMYESASFVLEPISAVSPRCQLVYRLSL